MGLLILVVLLGLGVVSYIDDPEGLSDRVSELPSQLMSILDWVALDENETRPQLQNETSEPTSTNLAHVDAQTRQEFLKEVELQIFNYTNHEREIRGLNKLRWDEELAKIARKHSQDMQDNDYFSHTNLNGDGPSERAEKYGYDTHKELGGGWYTDGIGENIGMMPTGNVAGHGYVSNNPVSIAYAEVQAWMNSPGHRENILDPEYDKIGVGVSYDGLYYTCTQDFW